MNGANEWTSSNLFDASAHGHTLTQYEIQRTKTRVMLHNVTYYIIFSLWTEKYSCRCIMNVNAEDEDIVPYCEDNIDRNVYFYRGKRVNVAGLRFGQVGA